MYQITPESAPAHLILSVELVQSEHFDPSSGYTFGKDAAMALMARSLVLFVLAGLCEIGGGYLIWQWWRNGAPWFRCAHPHLQAGMEQASGTIVLPPLPRQAVR